MSKIAILTDSSCDIPQEMAEKYGIDIMSFHILLDDVDYVERVDCTNTEFYDKMRAAKGVPSTAAITPIQFCEKYCQYVDEGYTDVIHVPINKSGSSTYNNALMAQGMLREERPEHHLNIHLLDHFILTDTECFSMRDAGRLPIYDFKTGTLFWP